MAFTKALLTAEYCELGTHENFRTSHSCCGTTRNNQVFAVRYFRVNMIGMGRRG